MSSCAYIGMKFRSRYVMYASLQSDSLFINNALMQNANFAESQKLKPISKNYVQIRVQRP